jgi:hypothetical protein
MRPRGVALQTALRVLKDEDTNMKFLYLANFCIGGKTDDNFYLAIILPNLPSQSLRYSLVVMEATQLAGSVLRARSLCESSHGCRQYDCHLC